MLENIVAWVLNNYIGEYLEDLNTDQLSVALLSGLVELENVPLRESALRKLDLPIEVKSGLLGKLTLSVPITRVRTEPWILKLSDVLIVVGPLSPSKRYDVEAVDVVVQEAKESQLNELEQKHKSELLAQTGKPVLPAQDSWWGASLVGAILNNIQLVLDNVHIRYEDDLTLPNKLGFSCGIRIQRMSVRTTNKKWQPYFVEPVENVNVFKKLELEGFSIYWNTEEKISPDEYTSKNIKEKLAPETHHNSFIIHPCSLELFMERNTCKFALKGSQPRFKFFIRPEEITCELSRRQMAELRALNREWARFERARQHRKWRPLAPIGENKGEWWLYAFNRILEGPRRTAARRSWQFAYTRAKHLNAYCRAYKRKLMSLLHHSETEAKDSKHTKPRNELAGCSQEDIALMKQIESDTDYSYHELYLFRETVFRNLTRELDKEYKRSYAGEEKFETLDMGLEEFPLESQPPGKEEVVEGGLYDWVTSFFVSSEQNAAPDNKFSDFDKLDLSELKNLPKSFNIKEMEEEILDVLHESWDDSTVLRRDHLLADISLRLDRITLRFIDSDLKATSGVDQRRVLALDLMGVSSKLELSPRQSSLSVQLSVQDMSIQRLRTSQGLMRSSSQTVSDADSSLMFSVAESTKILLAVGRKDNEGVAENKPIFSMHYRRSSPKLVVRHIVEGKFCPISAMYEEDAFSGLSTLFADDPLMFKTENDADSFTSYSVETHVLANFHIPSVSIEMRYCGDSPKSVREWDVGEPLVKLTLSDVSFGISTKERYLSQVKVAVGHIELRDLLHNADLPLLSTGRHLAQQGKRLSNSCPDIAKASGSDVNRDVSSLPNSSFLDGFVDMNHHRERTTGGRSSQEKVSEFQALVTFVDSRHPLFKSFSEKNCKVEVVLKNLYVTMNRRTMTALLDLFHLIGEQETPPEPPQEDTGLIREPYIVDCSIRLKSWKLDLHYPENKTHLGVISFSNTEIITTMKLNALVRSVSFVMLLDGIRIDDQTPLYSELYKERFILQDGKDLSRIELRVFRYLDYVEAHEWDAEVRLTVPKSMNLFYVHTQRFFFDFLDFWTHFLELQDLKTQSRAKAQKKVPTNVARCRLHLAMDIQGPATIILPLHQFHNQVIVMEASNINFSNKFVRMDQLKDIFNEFAIEMDYGYDTKVNCLLDVMHMVFFNLRISQGEHCLKPTTKRSQNYRVIGSDIFAGSSFAVMRESVFDKTFDLSVDFYKNLDSQLSHNIPDFSIITRIAGLTWNVTSDFYILLRGVLEHNFGDTSTMDTNTVPQEILVMPSVDCLMEDFKFPTFSFRMVFEDVTLNLQVPSSLKTPFIPFKNHHFVNFGKTNLCCARISFDAYNDQHSELNLICENTELIDTRSRPGSNNQFPTILRHKDKDKKRGNLMSEAHLKMRPDEGPSLILVLLNSKILLLADWLNDAKDFLLLSIEHKPVAHKDLRSHGGVVGRALAETQSEQAYSVKITLRESDIYLLEDPYDINSLALVASTTAVVNLNEHDGQFGVNLEIQSITLAWCLLNNDLATRTVCSSEFSIGIGVHLERETEKASKGLRELTIPRHKIEIEIRGAIGRFAYKDITIFQNIFQGFLKYITANLTRTMIPVLAPPPETSLSSKGFDIGRVVLKTDMADVWLLDENQGSSVPLLRLCLTNVNINYDSDRLVSSFTTNLDYFNQRVFGWEPLVEKWNILRFLWHKKNGTSSLQLTAESKNCLDINITEQFVQQAMQFSNRFSAIKSSMETNDFRNVVTRKSSDHLPYLLKNETGSDLVFTIDVDDVIQARNVKTSAKWSTVHKNKEQTFEFPTKLLLYTQSEREPPRQMIVKVHGWNEISPVNVDACGTYFRIVKPNIRGISHNARLIIRVTMEKDGKKVVAIRSSLEITNILPFPVSVYVPNHVQEIMEVGCSECLPVPLIYAHQPLSVAPRGCNIRAEIDWMSVKAAGGVFNTTQRLENTKSNLWLCTSVRREYYPVEDNLSGHSIHVVSPLSVQNLLPVDIELRIGDQVFAIVGGKQLQITTVDITHDVHFSLSTDRVSTTEKNVISKSQIGEGQLLTIQMKDTHGRPLLLYANLRVILGGSVSISFWVPYWIVNKSGIPLVIKQEAATYEAAGQAEEHERAKDRHPLLFSFADDGCPHQCMVRVGNNFSQIPGYRPSFGQKFPLTPGVQSLKLKLKHESLPALTYNIGIEVRPGTGKYKDTQVVLLTSRYLLNNLSSYNLSVCHSSADPSKNTVFQLNAQSTLVWNEKQDDEFIKVQRYDVAHWSCPFRIDRIGSFHVTMRDADETPRFIRVEIILSSAAFCVSFTDADYYPPPIRIDNQSDVPVLYQQETDGRIGKHLRTICKAKSHVDYAWDDLYGRKQIVLQVYENKSHSYDPSHPGVQEPLIYENNIFFQYLTSFESSKKKPNTEECELVMETMQRGKIMLNKQNRIDGNCGNQLWKLSKDGYVENVGMSLRCKEKMVLDVLETTGYQLMMSKKNPTREAYQKWIFMPNGQLCLQSKPDLFVTVSNSDIILTKFDSTSPANMDNVPASQMWRIWRQRPGSGTLDVSCLHNGPTLVIQIVDREKKQRALSLPPALNVTPGSWNLTMTLRSGLGVSLVNCEEELLYARLSGISIYAEQKINTYTVSASVDAIQADNQLIGTDKVPVLFCQADPMNDDLGYTDEEEFQAGLGTSLRPALKLEVQCTPMKNYDAFDCFRLKMCDVAVQLNELLMWRLVQFAQASDVASSVQQKTLCLPPNLEIERHNPLKTRRWYFGTLELEIGQIALSVVTVPKSSLPRECRQLKQQFNVKLVSFENATVTLPPFHQQHYFETSLFLLESLQKFYFAELQKQTLSIVVTLDAFGNPLGLVTDLKESFQGLFIEGDLQRFVAGLGYGVSNSISKVASSMASGVGALTFDQAHEVRRRNNMLRSQSSSSTPLNHLYSGVKGLGMGVFGGFTAIINNTITESKRSGIVTGTLRGITTGAVDTVTKPVQGLFDLVEGTASAMKELAGPSASSSRRIISIERVRPPRVCSNLYHLLPPYDRSFALYQQEMLRINGYSQKEKLLDVEICLEQFSENKLMRIYALITTKQCYICKQLTDEPSSVTQRISYKYLRSVEAHPELPNSCASLEVKMESDRNNKNPFSSFRIWCSRVKVASRLGDKIMQAKHDYDHSKRTLHDHIESVV